jgi:c(7)-type cytochrome triheme protein
VTDKRRGKMRVLIGFVVLALLVPSLAWGKIGGGDIVFHAEGAADSTFSHEAHVNKAALKCKDCHPAIFQMAEGYGKTKMADMAKGLSCGACHNGKKAFTVKANCVKCHPS